MNTIILLLSTLLSINLANDPPASTVAPKLVVHKSLLSKDKKSVTYYFSWNSKKYEIKYSSIGNGVSQIQLKNSRNIEKLVFDGKNIEYRGQGKKIKLPKSKIGTLLDKISNDSGFLFQRRFPIGSIGIKELYAEDISEGQTQALLRPILVSLYHYLTWEVPPCTEKSTCTCIVGNMQMTADCDCDEYLLCIYGNIQRCRVSPTGEEECETSHICTAECVK